MDLLKRAAGAVGDTVKDSGLQAACTLAEREVEKQTKRKIAIVCRDVPQAWAEWVRKTGMNSLCNPDTWVFLDNVSHNARRLDLWEERAIDTIVVTVARDVDDFSAAWKVCDVHWNPDISKTTMVVEWFPHARTRDSERYWQEPGPKVAWNLSDNISLGLQIYRQPGTMLYKSDWVDDFDDVDPDSFFAEATAKGRRWLQFRRWALVWYANAVPGWNFHWSPVLPKNRDGTEFTFEDVFKFESCDGVRLPDDYPLPSLLDDGVELPFGVEPPAPAANNTTSKKQSASEGGETDDAASRRSRPPNPYAPHGLIELSKLHVRVVGKRLILTNATVHHFWQKPIMTDADDGASSFERDVRRKERFELKCISEEQAESWEDTLLKVGCTPGEVNECCSCSVA